MERTPGSAPRRYLDHNATSPLLPVVAALAADGGAAGGGFGNPSSTHQEGREAKRLLDEAREGVLGTLGARSEDFDLVFHSGATEGINAVTRGFAASRPGAAFAHSATDHSAALAQRGPLEARGHRVLPLPVNARGDLDPDRAAAAIRELAPRPVLLHWTWVNNETGVVFPLEDALAVKEATGATIHVDAVQSVGRIEGWRPLPDGVDACTWSGHKFGAFKGTGLTLVRKGLGLPPLVSGGGQQGGLRAGTENVLGAAGLAAALAHVAERHDPKAQREAKDLLVREIKAAAGARAAVAGEGAGRTSAQTVCLVLDGERSDIVSIAFDLAGMAVGTGSACLSGELRPSHVLKAMGFGDEAARSAVRLSFSPYVDRREMEGHLPPILGVLRRFVT